jgi:hypothetical protein
MARIRTTRMMLDGGERVTPPTVEAQDIRDPKTGLTPAQVEAQQALAEAVKNASALGITTTANTVTPNNVPTVTINKNPWDEPPSEAPEGYTWKWIGAKSVGRAGSGSWQLLRVAKEPSGGGGGGGGGAGDGASDTGGTGGGLTQADVDSAIQAALAKQKADFDALLEQQNSETRAIAEAEKMSARTKARDKLTAMLAGWNLQGIATWLDGQIMADVSEEAILLGLYDQSAYQKRFPGMAALRKAGRTITEDEYIRIENQMIQTARFFDLPKGFYDSAEDFGDLIGKQVSAKEYQDRLQIGQDLARTLNAEVKQQLVDFYGVGEGDLTAYVLNADRALPLIQKQAKAAQFVGLGRAAGFSLQGITSQQAETIAGTETYAKLSEAELKQQLGQAGYLRKTQERLSQIEGMAYNEQEALSAVMEANPEALLASQQRAQREVARFGARGGVSAGSLKGTTAI